MNWIDYTIIGIMLLSMVIGAFRGLLKEVMGLVVWVVAFWVAWQFCGEGAMLLEAQVELPSARLAIAFGLLLVVTLILGALVNYLVQALVESTGLTGTDRMLGLFFGAGRALVLLIAAVLLAGLTPLPQDPWWGESRLLPTLQVMAEWATESMPPEVGEYFDFKNLPALPDSSPETADST